MPIDRRRATTTPPYARVMERSLARCTRGIAPEIPHNRMAGSTTHPSQTAASSTTTSRWPVDCAPPKEMPAMPTRTTVATTTAPTATLKATASRSIAARKPKNARPEARKSVIASSLVQAARSRLSIVAPTATPQPQSSTIDSARNARVRSRRRSHPSTVNAPSRMQAPPKAHDSTRVAVLKAPSSISPNSRIAPPSLFCEVGAQGLRCSRPPRSEARSVRRAQRLDDGVRNLGRADRGGIVALRLHVIGDTATLGDDPSNCLLEAVARRDFTDVTEHQHAAEHHRHRVGFVLPCVLGCAAVGCFEHRDLVADIGSGGKTQSAGEAGAEVAEDIAEQVRHHHHVVQLGPLHQLHRHVVDDTILELDLRKLVAHLL